MGAAEAFQLAMLVLPLIRQLIAGNPSKAEEIAIDLEAAGEAVARAQTEGRDLTADELRAFADVRNAALTCLQKVLRGGDR